MLRTVYPVCCGSEAHLTAKVHEFVRAEDVVFHYATPGGVDDFLSARFR